MNFDVIPLPFFEKQLKRLVKKFPSLKREYANLVDELAFTPKKGIPLGQNCYKIRLSIASKGAGKSGGARVITCLQVIDATVYLVSIYDKSEQENLTEKELADLIKEIP